jgi:large subunit ribosomal protein L31e
MIERTYVVALRKSVMQAPRTRRAKKAVFALRAYLTKNLKSDDIKLSNALNEHIWENGIRNPNMRIKIIATKDDKNAVFARLFTEKAPSKEKVDVKAKKAKADDKSKAVEATVVEETSKEEKPKKKAAKKAE